MSFDGFNPLTRHPFQTDDPSLLPIAAKVANAERLSFEDGVTLYRSGDILAVGWLANLVRERLHGNIAYFNVNRHINPTNVCVASCRLCAFGRKKGDAGTYTMALEEAWETAGTGLTEAVTEFHIVGGLHPDLPFEYFMDLVRGLKVRFPKVHIKAFTMVEVAFLAKRGKMTIPETLERMRLPEWIRCRVEARRSLLTACGILSAITRSTAASGWIRLGPRIRSACGRMRRCCMGMSRTTRTASTTW
jgi:aminodeoxyfutalosine synthase